ncbi:TrbI/VirB10 family protein [Nisaea sp.]
MMPDLSAVTGSRISRRAVVLVVGALIGLGAVGIAYGLAKTKQDKNDTATTTPYNVEIKTSSEEARIRDAPIFYAPPPKVEPEPLPAPVAEPKTTHIPDPVPTKPLIDREQIRRSALSPSNFSGADAIGSLALFPQPAEPIQAISSAPDPASEDALPSYRPGPKSLLPGTIIKARMDTAINTTHPGVTRARVVEAIFDSRNGLSVLVPQGALLTGVPSSTPEYGHERIFIAWNNITMPDGRVVDISGLSAGDEAGRGGLAANVDNHYFELFAAAAVTSILSVGASISSGDPEDPLTLQQRATDGLAQNLSATGQTLTGRAASIRPTMTLEPGQIVTVIVNRPIDLETR